MLKTISSLEEEINKLKEACAQLRERIAKLEALSDNKKEGKNQQMVIISSLIGAVVSGIVFALLKLMGV